MRKETVEFIRAIQASRSSGLSGSPFTNRRRERSIHQSSRRWISSSLSTKAGHQIWCVFIARSIDMLAQRRSPADGRQTGTTKRGIGDHRRHCFRPSCQFSMKFSAVLRKGRSCLLWRGARRGLGAQVQRNRYNFVSISCATMTTTLTPEASANSVTNRTQTLTGILLLTY